MSTEPKLSMLNFAEHPEGGWVVGVVAKRTYRVEGGRCVVDDEQVPLVEEMLLGEDEITLEHDLDPAMNRREVDIVVQGNAYTNQSGRRACDLTVGVGEFSRTLRVFGDRRCGLDSSGKIRFDEPSVFESLPLSWNLAYGGVDEVARQKLGDPVEEFCKEIREPYDPVGGAFAYPRNPVGKGYLIEATEEALAACALPNFEFIEDLLTPERLALGSFLAWPRAPEVASLGWLSYAFFPRSAMVGLPPLAYDEELCAPGAFPEVVRGFLKEATVAQDVGQEERLDLGFAQQAAVGMRTREVLPGQQVMLRHLHPRMKEWAFTLSTERPRMMLHMPDAAPAELTPVIRTVLFLPEEERVCVTFVGEQREELPIGPGKESKISFAVRW